MINNRVRNISWKKLGNILFLLIVFWATFFSVFHGEDIGELFEYLAAANDVYIVLGVLCVFAFILGESVVIFYMLDSLGCPVRFSHCCLYSFIGFFYSCITPSASGGQPMQVVAMRKDHIPVAVSTVVLAIVTITYKMVLVIIGLAVLIIRPESVMPFLEPVRGLIILGIILNLLFITLLLLLVFLPSLVHKTAEKLIFVFTRTGIIKHPEKYEQRLERVIDQYRGTAAFYCGHKRLMLNVLLVTFCQRCILFFVTWLVYRSFGLAVHSVPTIMSLQAMISVGADMLPLPGGMGVSEAMFLDIFLPIFGEELVLPGMVLSRGISFYTQLIVSAIMTLAASFVIRAER